MDIKRFFVTDLSRRLEEKLNFMQVLMGPRQVGKTTAIDQVSKQWSGSQIVVSADRVSPPGQEWIEFHWQRAKELPPPTLLALDEIQKIQGWSEVVKVLFDRDRKSKKLRVILSGSASLSLQQGLSESLAGRYELIRCPHWGLDEMKAAFGWDISTYLKFGGYPATAELIHEIPRWQGLLKDGIIEPVLGRDLMGLVQIQKPSLLRQLFELIMRYPAHEISYQKLLGQLQDRGNAATIKHYLEILKGAFLIEILEKYSTSPIKQKSSSPKLIPMAPALIHAFSDPNRMDNDPQWRGRVFEAIIGAQLSQLGGTLHYWRHQDAEVDFVLLYDRQVFAIEVKSGRKKSSSGLLAFKQKYPKALTLSLDWENGAHLLSERPSIQLIQNLIRSNRGISPS